MSEKITEEQNAPIARPEGQFMRSIEFETPNSPEVFSLMKNPPKVDVSCDEEYSVIDEKSNLYEVVLYLDTKANVESASGETTAFTCKLKYCGIFTIKNLNPDQMDQALCIEAPALLFPFARRIVATATTDAGFPPLMIAPINFAQKYINKKNKSD